MPVVFCLECTRLIRLKTFPVEGQVFPCSHCGAHLEVVDVHPLELDWANPQSSAGIEDWEWWKANKDLLEETEFDFALTIHVSDMSPPTPQEQIWKSLAFYWPMMKSSGKMS